jgi:GNAT superfamily N-acetyltransferase
VAEEPLDISIRQLEPGDRASGFSLGEKQYEPLKRFLRRDAGAFHSQNLAKTYVVVPGDSADRVIAYVTLVCGQIEIEQQVQESLDQSVQFTYSHCPAVKIARLAVDRRFKKRGIGKILIDFSLGIVADEICPRIGCRFIVVDAKRDAVPFYQDTCGFTLLETEENKSRDSPLMFVDLHKASR